MVAYSNLRQLQQMDEALAVAKAKSWKNSNYSMTEVNLSIEV